MVVKPFVSSACFTGFSLPPVLCPPHLNQRCVLYLSIQLLCLYSLSLFSLLIRLLVGVYFHHRRIRSDVALGVTEKFPTSGSYEYIYECDGSVARVPCFLFFGKQTDHYILERSIHFSLLVIWNSLWDNSRIPKSGLRGNLAATGVPTSVPVRVAHELFQAGHRYLDVRYCTFVTFLFNSLSGSYMLTTR
jgi:hypothetical protein